MPHRYYLPSGIIAVPKTKLLIGAGVGYYISVFSTKYALSDETGFFMGNEKSTKTYCGFGLNLETALEYNVNSSWALKFLLNCDITRVSKTSVGGLGNIGGLLIACRVAINF